MIITTAEGIRNKALRLMSRGDSQLAEATEDFRNRKGRPIYLEQIGGYGLRGQVIACGPLQCTPDNSVYVSMEDLSRQKIRGEVQQLYLGENVLVSQDVYRLKIRNNQLIFLNCNRELAEKIKRDTLMDFVRPAFKEPHPCQRYVIFQTLGDKDLVAGTLERIADELKDIELATAKEWGVKLGEKTK